ncbi:MAG: hypothetical protein R6W06_04480 [Prochlorococcaceae cyanobacterium]
MRNTRSTILASATFSSALLLLLLAGCSSEGSLSAEAQRRCRLQSQQTNLLLRPFSYRRCLATIEEVLAQESLADQKRQQQQVAAQQKLCEQKRAAVQRLLPAFRAEEAESNRLQAERYSPLPGPRPLSPDERRSLPQYDQELLDERYDAELQAWRSKEESRRRAWERSQVTAMAASRSRLAALAAELQGLDARLLRQLSPPLLNPQAVQQALACSKS